jgi:uncharacterized protein YbaA (DUF1428 family)
MAYVDGFVLPMPKKNLAKYRKLAKLAGKVWREHGALDYKECIADDVPMARSRPFRAASSRRQARPWSSPGSHTSREPIAIASTRK